MQTQFLNLKPLHFKADKFALKESADSLEENEKI